MKPKEVIIVGAGGHALSLAEFASDLIQGYLANGENPLMPGELLGSDNEAANFLGPGSLFHMAFVYSGWPKMDKRRALIEKYESLGASFVSLIAPTAIVTSGSVISEGCAVMNGAIVNRARLGKHVIVNSGAIVEHDCNIGENTFIGPGAVIGGFTDIGRDCFIGLGAKIGNGLKIADGITVAMGAVVNRNLSQPGIYHGNPLKCTKI